MKIIIDTDKKFVSVEDYAEGTGMGKNYPTGDPAEILWIVADLIVPHPKEE